MIEIIVLLFGATIGSFGNNIISYYVGSSRFDVSRSSCLCGEKELSWYDVIPVFSFIQHLGRCRFCKKIIPVRYLLMETTHALLALLCWINYGWTWSALFNFTIVFTLLVIAFIDFESMIIPNQLVLLLFVMAPVGYILFGNFDLLNIFISILLLSTLCVVNFVFEKINNRSALGYGDIKLLAVLALLYPALQALIGLWLASVLAIAGFGIINLYSRRESVDKRIPFGFYLGISYTIINIAGDTIEMEYYRLFFY